MLRDYQIDICSRVSEAFEHHRSVMVQMPTGTGKTMVLAELVKQLMMKDEGVRILIVAHRRELIEQIKATIKRMKMDSRNITFLLCRKDRLLVRQRTDNSAYRSATRGQELCHERLHRPTREGIRSQHYLY